MLTPEELKAELQNMANPPTVLLDRPEDTEYEEKRKTFNLRFSKRPATIVFCTTTEQVAHVVKVAGANRDYPLRVKSGGHDHEGECSKTDAIVIDFQRMKTATFSDDNTRLTVQPGLRFIDVLYKLDERDVSIPHGTCETVGIFGFTLGGGWGPWTRLHGMCCERLVEATIVLGDGSIRKVREEDKDSSSQEFLWALRGGGGFSYGIVTEMVIKTFKQPPATLRFSLSWERSNETKGFKMPAAIDVLEAWENVIVADANPQLMGTNLKIMAIPEDDLSVTESIHDCVFNGYYAGDEDTLRTDLKNWFGDYPEEGLEIMPKTRNKKPGEGDQLSWESQESFSSWDRVSTVKIMMKEAAKDPNSPPRFMPPDDDRPAPHKLTCRLVQEGGLGKEGRENLIRSLRSNLISQEGIDAYLHTYVTLGAISGPYYHEEYKFPAFPAGSAFPFKKRPYTIQYQAWWDEKEDGRAAGKHYHVNKYANRAIDWIGECRSNHFPQTNGSFISFKDSSVPTRQYFMESYDALKRIKETYSKDPDNMFSSRKTII